jgi:hypothetical protein
MSMFVWQQSNYRAQLCRYALLQDVLLVACMAGKLHPELVYCDGWSGAHSWQICRHSNTSICRFLTKCHEGIIKELFKITCSFVCHQSGAILSPFIFYSYLLHHPFLSPLSITYFLFPFLSSSTSHPTLSSLLASFLSFV